MIQLRKELGSYFRSTLIHIRNETGTKFNLKSRSCKGKWLLRDDMSCEPPSIVHPYSEAVFASVSRFAGLGGTEGEVTYDTRGHGPGLAWFCKLTWANPMMADEKGRYCEVQSGREGARDRLNARNDRFAFSVIQDTESTQFGSGALDQFFVTKDDDDQEPNSEVFFTITSIREQETARKTTAILGQQYVAPRKGSAVAASSEVVKAGMLAKRRPDGLSFLWQKRWFVLTNTKLCYFKSSADTRAHAQLGQIPLKHVIAVHTDEADPAGRWHPDTCALAGVASVRCY